MSGKEANIKFFVFRSDMLSQRTKALRAGRAACGMERLSWTKALNDGEADVCILLTEGIVKDIVCNKKSKIVSTFVSSPLCWGIHTGNVHVVLVNR
eukprot:767176-Hanusia_phi.AAC.5